MVELTTKCLAVEKNNIVRFETSSSFTSISSRAEMGRKRYGSSLNSRNGFTHRGEMRATLGKVPQVG